MYTVQKEPYIFTSSNVSGEYSVCVRVYSAVANGRVILYAVQSMTPRTGCMIVLLNYINVLFIPPLHILFASNDCISTTSFSPAVILVLSLITAGAVLSYLCLACIAF